MNLPTEFLNNMRLQLGAEFDDFVAAIDAEPIVSIRLNPNKKSDFTNYENVAWCKNGYYLPQRPQFTLDPNFHAGAYYAQEASSMFLEQAINQHLQNNGEKIIALDLCAAPGGKTTHLLSLLPENALLVSNETIKNRANILVENVVKWGYANVVVTNNDPKDFLSLKNYFDVIVVDAPCSGEGMFRKDNAAANEWSAANVQLCAERQQRIIFDVWNALKCGGLLIFSTCTYNITENDENIKYLIEKTDAQSLKINLNDKWNIVERNADGVFTYRFYPHKTRGEGFCLSAVRKNGDLLNENIYGKKQKNAIIKSLPKDFNFTQNCICNNNNFTFFCIENKVKALPSFCANDIFMLYDKLHAIHSGIQLGEIKGRDFIPSQTLALSRYVNFENFNCVDVDKKTALQFLHKENVNPATSERGYNLVRYNGNALGWIKNIGNRANNLYPPEWRIRMSVDVKD